MREKHSILALYLYVELFGANKENPEENGHHLWKTPHYTICLDRFKDAQGKKHEKGYFLLH